MSNRNDAVAEWRLATAGVSREHDETKALLDALSERQHDEACRLLDEVDEQCAELGPVIDEIRRRAAHVIEELNKGAKH